MLLAGLLSFKMVLDGWYCYCQHDLDLPSFS